MPGEPGVAPVAFGEKGGIVGEESGVCSGGFHQGGPRAEEDGKHDEAERLRKPGSERYPDGEDLEYFAEVAK